MPDRVYGDVHTPLPPPARPGFLPPCRDGGMHRWLTRSSGTSGGVEPWCRVCGNWKSVLHAQTVAAKREADAHGE